MITEQWQIDECPDARGFYTIRPEDGTSHGNTEESPVATVYTEEHARIASIAPELLKTAQSFRTWWANNFDDFSKEVNSQLLCLDNDFAQAIQKARI